jgi:cytidine deaminase
VENGAYTPSSCAERTAICKAVSEGFREFTAVAVVAFQEDSFTAPCGVCRQVICEFAKKDIPVYFSKPVHSRVLVTSAYELLPNRFCSEKLKLKH